MLTKGARKLNKAACLLNILAVVLAFAALLLILLTVGFYSIPHRVSRDDAPIARLCEKC